MTERFEHKTTGDVVDAHQVPRGSRERITNYAGEDEYAYEGNWVITYPWYEIVDPQSFDEDYQPC